MGRDIDLTKLSREEKLRMVELLEEQARRDKLKKPPYKPNKGQLLVHQSKKTVRYVAAGNGGGKTTLGVMEALWALSGVNPIKNIKTPVPTKGIVVLDKPEKVADLWMPALQQWGDIKEEYCSKQGKPYISKIQFPNGSELRFYFHDQAEMSFESVEADWVIFDEPPPRHVWIGLRRSGRRKHRQPWYLFIGTMISGAWMRKELYEPWARGELPEMDFFKYGTDVNASNLADGYIENYGKFLTEKEKAIRFKGEFFDLDGLALAHLFHRTTHLLPVDYPYDREAPAVVVIDPHPNKNHVSLLLTCDRDGYLYAVKEYSSKEVPRDYARSLKKWYQGHRVIDIICDSAGNTPMSGGDGNKSFIDVLKGEGIQVRATTYDDKSDDEFIMRVQDVLGIEEKANNFGQKFPKLRIMADMKGLIGDIETVQWQKIKNMDEYKPKLDIGSKDFLACLKYGLAANLNYTKSKAKMWRRSKPVKAYGQRW